MLFRSLPTPADLFALQTQTVPTILEPLLATSPTLAEPAMLQSAPPLLLSPPQPIQPAPRRPWAMLLAVFVLPLFVGAAVIGVLLLTSTPQRTDSGLVVRKRIATAKTTERDPGPLETAYTVVLPEELADLTVRIDGKAVKANKRLVLTRGPHELVIFGTGVEEYARPIQLDKATDSWDRAAELKQSGVLKVVLADYRPEVGAWTMRLDEAPATKLVPGGEVSVPVGSYTLRLSGKHLPATMHTFTVRRREVNVVDLKPEWRSSVRFRHELLRNTDKVTLGGKSGTAGELDDLQVLPGAHRLKIDGLYLSVDELVTLAPGANDTAPSKVTRYGYLKVHPSDVAEDLLIAVADERQTIRNKPIEFKIVEGEHTVSVKGAHAESDRKRVSVVAGTTVDYYPKYTYFGRRQLKISNKDLKVTVKLDGELITDWPTAPLRGREGQRELQVSATGMQTVNQKVDFARTDGNDIQITLFSANELTFDLGGGEKLRLLQIEGGTTTLGTTDQSLDGTAKAKPEKVAVRRFALGEFEVTQGQYRAVMGKMPAKAQPKTDDDLPVVSLTVAEMEAFCAKLSAATGRKIRLPTEHEWEYACRCGGEKSYNFGKDAQVESIRQGNAHFDGTLPYDGKTNSADPKGTTPSGPVDIRNRDYPANAFGLRHMHGNVAEMCTRSWDDDKATKHFIRGGSYKDAGVACHAAKREALQLEGYSSPKIGFRIVCE